MNKALLVASPEYLGLTVSTITIPLSILAGTDELVSIFS